MQGTEYLWTYDDAVRARDRAGSACATGPHADDGDGATDKAQEHIEIGEADADGIQDSGTSCRVRLSQNAVSYVIVLQE